MALTMPLVTEQQLERQDQSAAVTAPGSELANASGRDLLIIPGIH